MEESKHIQNQNQEEKEEGLGFDPQLDPTLQTPVDYDDEIAVQIMVEELQNLVLTQSFTQHTSKSEHVYGDDEHYEYAWTDSGNQESDFQATYEPVDDEKPENAYGDDHYGYGWNENEHAVGENNKGEEMGWREGGFNANERPMSYPLRPDAADCAYYMKTGTCKYGFTCRFNHPSQRQYQQGAMEGKKREVSDERTRQIECKYHLTAGGCKYGNLCKFNHSRGMDEISPVLELNFLGLPIRPGEKECPYYMRTGSCKYGSNCRFHHPDPTTVTSRDSSSGYDNGGSVPVLTASYPTASSWSSPSALNGTAPYVPVAYPASQGISPPSTQWNGFKAPVYPTSAKSLPTPPAFTVNDPAPTTNFYPRPQQNWLVEEYPERPGQPNCSYFVKTGDCKYKSNCKFHHPKTQISKTSFLSDKGLPLRPDQAVCSFYSRYGICKFGPACKFDHPEHYDSLAASTGSAFYNQPPFGNSAGTTNGSRW